MFKYRKYDHMHKEGCTDLLLYHFVTHFLEEQRAKSCFNQSIIDEKYSEEYKASSRF